MIALIGDIHGDWDVLKKALRQVPLGTVVIQVGDFGFWPGRLDKLARKTLEHTIFAIDGNHEDFRLVGAWNKEIEWGVHGVHRIMTNLHYVPRGTVLNIDDKWVGFLGGGESVDYHYRTLGFDWFHEERITEEEVDRLVANADRVGGLDLLVTHAPPDPVIRRNFDDAGLLRFGLDPLHWTDPSAHRVNDAWRRLGHPILVCGHMHRTVDEGVVHLLGIGEVIFVV